MYAFEDEQDVFDSIGSYGGGVGDGSEAGEHEGEVYEVLREIGFHLGGFLAIGLIVNLLLAFFGAV